jgi:RNA polymerase sigma-70 factor (ECF subfamily)
MDVLAKRFEDSRPHLAAVAHRMLGSRAEADDAVQEAWLRLARSDVDGVDNLRGWLTTVVARVCLDMLRSRTSRREEPLTTDERVAPEPGPEPESWQARVPWRAPWQGFSYRPWFARARCRPSRRAQR